jgi:hypothetical protein
MSAARRIDETKLRRALGRVLAPALAAKVVEEATIADDDVVPEKKRATSEDLARAEAWARRQAKR